MFCSLCSRRLEVVGERDNGRSRETREGCPLACLLLARPFFLVPTTSKRLLRRLHVLTSFAVYPPSWFPRVLYGR